jgi:hypothetical protein
MWNVAAFPREAHSLPEMGILWQQAGDCNFTGLFMEAIWKQIIKLPFLLPIIVARS